MNKRTMKKLKNKKRIAVFVAFCLIFTATVIQNAAPGYAEADLNPLASAELGREPGAAAAKKEELYTATFRVKDGSLTRAEDDWYTLVVPWKYQTVLGLEFANTTKNDIVYTTYSSDSKEKITDSKEQKLTIGGKSPQGIAKKSASIKFAGTPPVSYNKQQLTSGRLPVNTEFYLRIDIGTGEVTKGKVALIEKKHSYYIRVIIGPSFVKGTMNQIEVYDAIDELNETNLVKPVSNQYPITYPFFTAAKTIKFCGDVSGNTGDTKKIKIQIGEQIIENATVTNINIDSFEKDNEGNRYIPVILTYEGNPDNRVTFYLKADAKDHRVKFKSFEQKSITCAKDANVELKVEIDGGEPKGATYQWYKNTGVFTPIENATDKTYKVDTSAATEYSYLCRAKVESDGQTYLTHSDIITVKVEPTYAAQPAITTQPKAENRFLINNEVGKLFVKAEPRDWKGKLSYQWYQNTENSTKNGTKIEGATDRMYIPSQAEAKTMYYYCVVGNTLTKTDSTTDTAYQASEAAKVDFVTYSDYLGLTNGKGSEEKPFEIASVTDLEKVRDAVNQGNPLEGMFFLLTADITLPAGWEQIGTLIDKTDDEQKGTNVYPFMGTLMGGRDREGAKTITIANGGKAPFHYVRQAAIKNLNLQGSNIDGAALISRIFVDYGTDANYDTGVPWTVQVDGVTLKAGSKTSGSGLIDGNGSGKNNVEIRNCTIEKDVTIGTQAKSKTGAFISCLNGSISNCTSYATVCGKDYVGGLAGIKGQSMGDCTIQNSAFYGKIEATGDYIGGIIGSGYHSDSAPNTPIVVIKNCFAVADVSGKDCVGGIFGGEPSCICCWNNGAGTISNNYFKGTVRGTSAKARVGGIIGFMRSVNKYQGMDNNFYNETCTAASGIGEIETIITKDHEKYGEKYGIEGDFKADEYCIPISDAEFAADGALVKKLNNGQFSYKNWAQGKNYPVFSSEPIVYKLMISGAKTNYHVGDTKIDKSGMILTGLKSDGSKIQISPEDSQMEFSGFETKTAGQKTITVRYGAAETKFNILVTYAQPKAIKAYVRILGDEAHGEGKGTHTLQANNLDTWVERMSVTINQNTTVRDVLEEVAAKKGIVLDVNPESQYGYYVKGMTKDGIYLAEFTNGSLSGWMYTVNGKHPEVSAQYYYLSNRDEVVWHYTDDYTKEEGSDKWGAPGADEVKNVTTSGAAGFATTTAPTEVKVSGTTGAVTVKADNQKEILKQAKEKKSAQVVLVVANSDAKGAEKLELNLDKSFLESLLKDTNAKLVVKTPLGQKTYERDELQKLVNETTGTTVKAEINKDNVDTAAEEPTEENAAKIEKAKSIIKDLKLTARSSKTAKKNIKAVLKSDAKVTASIKELKDLGYTVKYRFYRSTKKAAGYKAAVTKKTASYTNTSGKKGTKYFYKVQVRVYDENGKLVAKTALKQCKYATRTWSKAK